MRDLYLDYPHMVESWVNRLTDREHTVFDQGMAFGLRVFQEELTDMKIGLYLKLMEIKGDIEFENQLLSRIHTVDSLQKSIKKRLERMDTAI